MADSLHIHDLTPGKLLEVDGRKLVWERELGDDLVLIRDEAGNPLQIRNAETGIRTLATGAWVESVLMEGQFKLCEDPEAPVRELARARELDHDELRRLDPMAEARLALVRGLVGRGVYANDPNLSKSIDDLWTGDLAARFGERPVTSTVRDWLRRVGDPTEATLVDMVSMSGRVRRAKRLLPEEHEIADAAVAGYWAARGHRLRDCETAVFVATTAANVERRKVGLPPLRRASRETLRRKMRATESFDSWKEKFGEKAARARYTASRGGLTASRILQYVLIDDTDLDVTLVLQRGSRVVAGKAYISGLLDVPSRCCLALEVGFVPPSMHTAANLLKKANRPKRVRADRAARYPVLNTMYGRPAVLIADNGAPYASPKFQDAMADCRIGFRLVPVERPQWKAPIERFFRTLKTWVADRCGGATLDPATLRAAGLEPSTTAVLTVEEMRELLDEFLYVYHITIHSGIGTQPAAAWERSLPKGRHVIADERKLDVLLGSGETARLTRNGIRFRHCLFRNPEETTGLLDRLQPLEKVRGRPKASAAVTVKIKYFEDDAGRIEVFDRTTHTYVTFRNVMPDYADGLEWWAHDKLRKFAQSQNLEFNTEEERLQAQADFNELLERLMPDMAARQRRAAARLLQGTAPRHEPEVEIAFAQPRHDGLAPVFAVDTAEDRIDAEAPISRPARGSAPVPADGHDEPDDSEVVPAEPDDPLNDEPWSDLFRDDAERDVEVEYA